MNWPFYASLVNEIEKDLRIRGYKTLLCNTAGEKTNEKTYLEMLQRNMEYGRRCVDGNPFSGQ